MKQIALIIGGLFMLINVLHAQQDTLFTIQEHGRTGYINRQGQIVLPAKYFGSHDFQEGLAAVREQGHYGFINTKGEYVIAPAFDEAYGFNNGYAIVTKNAKTYIIDRTGKAILPPVYTSMYCISPYRAIISTINRMDGMIELPSGKLIIDTVYERLDYYKEGVVIGMKYTRKGYGSLYAVIDTTGRAIVREGQYANIKPFVNGFAAVVIESKKSDDHEDGLIDLHGRLLFRRPGYGKGDMADYFKDGFARVSELEANEKSYEGYLDLKGKIVFADTNYTSVTDFSGKRAFIATDEDEYYLIDTTFKKLNEESFLDVKTDGFVNGYAIVQKETGWGIIDRDGNFVVAPEYRDIDRIVGQYFVFDARGEGETPAWGIMSLSGKSVIKPVLQDYDKAGYVHGLLKAIYDNRLTYFDEKGAIVWQEVPDTSTFLRKLNIDCMRRAGFSAYSTLRNEDEFLSGGWAVSRNFPRKKLPAISIRRNQLSLVVNTEQIDTIAKRYTAFPVHIINTTADTVHFRAQDSELYMKMQAQNERGVWQDIEYMPSSFCGNSYHQLALEPGACWQFLIPDYEGALQTMMRIELKYIDPLNGEKDKIIYSNTFKGAINPGQFTSKKTYFPSGIMDPYFD